MKSKGIVIAFLLTVSGGLFASPVDLQLGARPQAMGGAFAAVCDDVNAPAWNPAGLSFVRGSEIGFMHGMLSDYSGINIDFMSYSQRLQKGGVGFSWLNVGAVLKEGEAGTKSRMSENTYSLAYAVSPVDKFSLGFALKRLTLDSKVGGGGGLGFDMGSFLRLSRYFTAAVVARNVATDVKDEYFPVNYRLGLAGKFWQGRCTVSADADTKKDINGTEGTTVRSHAGLEVYPARIFALRAGFDNGSPTAGFGLKMGKWNIDYAWLSNENIGAENRLSAVYSFETYGVKQPAPKKKKVKKIKGAVKKKTEKSKNQKEKLAGKYYKKGLKYFRKKKYRKSLDMMKRSLSLVAGYKDAGAYADRARENIIREEDAKRAKRKKKTAGKRVKMSSKEKEEYYRRGQAFFDKSEFDRAIEAFDKILTGDPNYKHAANWKASAEKQKIKQAETLKKKYYGLAISAYQKGDYKTAKKYFQKILLIDPSHAKSKEMVQKCDKHITAGK